MSPRRIVTSAAPFGVKGDVCPDTASTMRLRKIVTATSAGVGVIGAQDGPKAFAAARREVPT